MEAAGLSDKAFGRLIAIGVLFGIPIMFIVFFPMFLLGTGQPGAAPAVLWASLVGGGYFGGFFVLLAMERGEPDESTPDPER